MGAEKLDGLTKRLAEVDARLDELAEDERDVGRGIGAKVAAGKAPGKLREKRQDIRSEIEDLVAARPVLERKIEAAERELAAERRDAALERLAAVEDEATEWGDKLREILADVQAHLDGEKALDGAYKRAQRDVGGGANGHVADVAGIGIKRMQMLRGIVAEVV